ncbi:MAG: AI-2E family transporter [Brevefilum sp.]|nr:AI-2E family transporter [Brevefilum sp.]MDT8382284.1 AI-2E family transporter [Brevefilum sp.]MDW7755142.1 AI-2E family transporter [Brevefilum sp.]
MLSDKRSIKETEGTTGSPKWNWPTKLVVGLTLVAISIWLLVQFQNFLGPLISALILSYFLYPVATFLRNKIKLPWRLAVTIIYLLLVLILLGLLTWGGLALVEQIQNLIRFIENNINRLPELVDEITTQTYQIGPFTISPIGLDWEQIANQVVSAIQPLLGRLGSIVGSVAAGAASIFSWLALIILISYFLLAESEGIPGQLLNIRIQGYEADIDRMGKELSRVWKGFIRGEIFVVIISLFIYSASLGILGIQFFFGLAVIAAFGQLIPYVGAWVTWISIGLVALLQSNTPFDLPSGIYMLIVLGVGIIINTIIDNILRTKVMAENLRVHPALILMGALIGVQIFGFIGIIIAAPIMASLKLFLHYVIRKLSDRDPWKDLDLREAPETPKWIKFLASKWQAFRKWLSNLIKKFKGWIETQKIKYKKGN